MMAMDTMRERIYKARKNAPQAYHDMLINTLENLPVHRHRRHLKYAAPIVAGVVLTLILALALPSIAHAAMTLLDNLFSRQVQILAEEQDRPAEERAREMADEIDGYGYYFQTCDDTSMVVGGMDARLVSVRFYPTDGGGYEVQCVVGYSDVIEGFDPAWIDYTLALDGDTYASHIDNGTEAYRRHGLVADDGGMYTPWQFVDGVMMHYIPFTVGSINLDSPIDVAVSASLNTVGEGGVPLHALGELHLTCIFDREIATIQELERMRAVIPEENEYLDRKIDLYGALSLEAVPINAQHEANGNIITVNDMSIMDGRIYLTVTCSGDGVKLGKSMMTVERIRVDGKASPFRGSSEEDINARSGEQAVMHSATFPADPRRLPNESFIYIEYSQEVGGGAVVFRYNWDTRMVDLPEDSAEEAIWLAEEQALADSLVVDFNNGYIYAVNAVCRRDGVTMVLDSVTVSGNVIIDYSIEGKTLKKHDIPHDYEITMDGLPVTQFMGFGRNTVQFSMPMHPSELSEIVDVTLSVPMIFDDGTADTFVFSFTLNQAEARYVYDIREKKP